EVYEDFATKVQQNGEKCEAQWNELLAEYKQTYPELGEELTLAIANELPENWDQSLPVYEHDKDTLATRVASSEMINAVAKTVPNLFGGSADLASSNNTMMKEDEDFTKENYAGRNIWFGVREFAMG